jgi:catechol 2,3-dioxygenase-like lactoylglutathione lyase family enzyme
VVVTRIRHLALFVPELRAVEEYYRALFDLEVVGREAPVDPASGGWATLPPDRDWDDAAAAGVELGMVALRRDGFVLALFPGAAASGQVFSVGLVMEAGELAAVRGRLGDEPVIGPATPSWLAFFDRYGIHWQLSTGEEFRTQGEMHGRWLEA